MTAIIWKELRENLKWAVVWMLGVAVAMGYVLARQRQPAYYWQGIESLCSETFLLVTTFGSAVGGVLLGLVQTVPELRREQWAFLVHRPISRTRIFLAKVIAGGGLYLLAMGLPLLSAALWAATPGRLAAPFDGRMVLPGVADILTGGVFYLAGLLTGLRTARWYGSRALGIAAALPCAFCTAAVPEFWQAVLIAAGFAAVLGAAAWGSFWSGGEYRPQPRVARVALGLTLFGGLLVVGLIVSVFVAQLVLEAPTSWSSYAVTKDGAFVRVTYALGQITRVTDLEGREVDQYRHAERGAYDGRSLRWALSIAGDWGAGPNHYRSVPRFYQWLGCSEQVHWYWVAGQGRVLGFAAQDRRLIGSFGPDGFVRAARKAPQRFEGQLIWPSHRGIGWLALSSGIWRLDVVERRVEPLFAPEPGDQIRGAIDGMEYGEVETPVGIVAATRERVYFLSRDGHPLASVPYACDRTRYPVVASSILEDGRLVVWYSPSYRIRPALRKTMPDVALLLAPDGHQLQRRELPPIAEAGAASPWYAITAAAAVVPLAGAMADVIGRLWAGRAADPAFAWDWSDLRETWGLRSGGAVVLASVVLIISALACGIATFALAHRYAFARRATRGWPIASLLGGPAALLALVALREWPARERCARCGRMRVVERELCEHCGVPLPVQVGDGTEIFD